jgi:hypothetical protein
VPIIADCKSKIANYKMSSIIKFSIVQFAICDIRKRGEGGNIANSSKTLLFNYE